MKILQLTKKFPYPLNDGESWAVTSLARGLRLQGCFLDLFALNTAHIPFDSERKERLIQRNLYEDIKIVDAGITPGIFGALANLFSSESYHAERFHKPFVEEAIRAFCEGKQYHVIIFETIYMMWYAALLRTLYPQSKIVCRTHNLEFLIWKRYSKNSGGIKGWYFNLQANRLYKFEKKVIKNCDLIFSISSKDGEEIRKAFKPIQPIYSIPIGMKAVLLSHKSAEDRPFIFGFIGSLDWRPNFEGLDWFLRRVWCEMNDAQRACVLMIAGSGQKKHHRINGYKNINFVSEVEDSDNFLQRIDALIVPILSGSGTRVKILQAFRNKTPVITTSIGVEGIEVANKQEVLIADTPREWYDAYRWLIEHPDEMQKMTQSATEYLKKSHDPVSIGREVKQIVAS